MELHQILVDDTDRVKMIAESMREIGLQTPISVWSPDNGGTIRLVAGRHRLEAAKLLGWDHIECSWLILGETERRMWEIAENLHRAELTVLERSEHIEEWRRLTEQKVSQLAAPLIGGTQPAERAVRKTARELGVDAREVERSEKIADLKPEAREEAKILHLDDNQTALLEAAKEESQEGQIQALRGHKAKKRAPQSPTRSSDEVCPEPSRPDGTQDGPGSSVRAGASTTPVAAALARDRHVEAVIAAVQKLSETELAVFTDWFEAWRSDAGRLNLRLVT